MEIDVPVVFLCDLNIPAEFLVSSLRCLDRLLASDQEVAWTSVVISWVAGAAEESPENAICPAEAFKTADGFIDAESEILTVLACESLDFAGGSRA